MAHRQAMRQLRSLRTVLCGVSAIARQPATNMLTIPTTRHLLQPLSASIHTTMRHNNANIINIQNEEDFKKRVLESATPVIVDFHAVWCGPCKMLGPRLESMISERDGKVLLAKVDIDENGDLAMEHGVQAVPTVLGMKDGKVVDKFVGMKDDDSLGSFIDGLVIQ